MSRPTPRPDVNSSVHYEEITKSDTVNFTSGYCSSIYVGGAGVVQVVRWDDVVVPHTVPAGVYLHVVAKRVNSTSTTATLMVAYF